MALAAEQLADIGRSVWGLEYPPSTGRWSNSAGVRLAFNSRLTDGRYQRLPVPTISLRPEQEMKRPIFTFCHELAHHLVEECRGNVDVIRLLDRSLRRQISDMSSASPEEEELCDAIAVAFLLTRESVEEWSKAHHGDAEAFLNLASRHNLETQEALRWVATVLDRSMAYVEVRVDEGGTLAVTKVVQSEMDLPADGVLWLSRRSPTDRVSWFRWVTPATSHLVRATQADLPTREKCLLVTLSVPDRSYRHVSRR